MIVVADPGRMYPKALPLLEVCLHCVSHNENRAIFLGKNICSMREFSSTRNRYASKL
jgi:hypothetical protein